MQKPRNLRQGQEKNMLHFILQPINFNHLSFPCNEELKKLEARNTIC